MSSTQHFQQAKRLTSRRDPETFVYPDAALVELRRSGAWPKLEQYDPTVGAYEVVAVARYNEAREIIGSPMVVGGQSALKVEGSTSSIPGFITHMNGEDHRRVRSVVIRHLNHKRVQQMRPRVEYFIDELLSGLEARKHQVVDLVSGFARELPSLVMCDLLGMPYEDHVRLLDWVATILDLDSSQAQVHAATRALHEYLRENAARAKDAPGKDLLSTLVSESPELSPEEAVGLAVQIVAAGMDSTTRSTALGILCLLMYPDQREIVNEDGMTDAMADELLRFLSPIPSGIQRLATEDIQVGDKLLKKGERVMVSWLAANFDPEFIGDSPGLDLRRGRTAHLSFGFGIHQCPGQHLARLEMTAAVTILLRRFPRLELACAPEDLTWRANDVAYCVEELPVILEPRDG